MRRLSGVILCAAKYAITIQQVERWLEGASISPNEMVKKAKLKRLCGLTDKGLLQVAERLRRVIDTEVRPQA